MTNHQLLASSSSFLFAHANDLVVDLLDDTSTSDQFDETSSSRPTEITYPCCIFRCKANSYPFDERCIPLNEQVKIGRAVARFKPDGNNAIFDCKVLSRQHAKIWYENGKFLLQDTKSSNGTFVNDERIGQSSEESLPHEIYSDDTIQFGVDVTEANRKTIHNCIIMEVKLYYPDGSECLSRNFQSAGSNHVKNLDMNTQNLYQLAQCLQEAIHREQILEKKLEHLQIIISNTKKSSNETWQAIINEDRLLTQISLLEDQLRIYRMNNSNSDQSKQELIELNESYSKFEEELKKKLERVLNEYSEAINRCHLFESSLKQTVNQLVHVEEQDEQHKQDIHKLMQSIDEQRLLISELEINLYDSKTRCIALETDKQKIENNFNEYYERVRQFNQVEMKINQIHVNDEQKLPNGYVATDSIDTPKDNNELDETQNKVIYLQKCLNEMNERLVLTENLVKNEKEHYRSLTCEHDLINDELIHLKVRLKKETINSNELIVQQQTELNHLSNSISSKQNEHDQLVWTYILFLISCYLLMFFFVFFLLSF